MCARHNSEERGAVYWLWVAQGRQEIGIDSAWKHVEVLLVERESNWGEKEREEGACRVDVDQRVGWVGLGREDGWSY